MFEYIFILTLGSEIALANNHDIKVSYPDIEKEVTVTNVYEDSADIETYSGVFNYNFSSNFIFIIRPVTVTDQHIKDAVDYPGCPTITDQDLEELMLRRVSFADIKENEDDIDMNDVEALFSFSSDKSQYVINSLIFEK